MKAILVIDMPDTCCECKMFWNDADCGCMALGRVLGEFGCSVGKPVDCPLKPMPAMNKLEEVNYLPVDWNYFNLGWNSCINTILGDTE